MMRLAFVFPLLLAACGATGIPLSDPESEVPGAATGVQADIEIGQVEAESPASGGLAALFRAPPKADSADTDAAGAPAPEPTQGGILGGLFSGGGGSAASKQDDVAAGTPLPFGQVARVCSARTRDMGKVIDKSGKWKLYDTIPNTTAPHTLYLTGFKDGCARQFTAALVLFGSAAAHETVRYTLSSPYSETDEEYEAIKARICGVRRNSPCPADRIDKMEKQVDFVTAYPGFGSESGPWLEMLLYQGELRATAVTKR